MTIEAKRPLPPSAVKPEPPSGPPQSESLVVLTCVYCGHEYGPGIPASNHPALTEHVAQCPAHPMRAVVEQRDALLAALKDFMRSACRYGDDGKFDDMFDASRKRAREIVASVEASARVKGTP